MAVRLCHFCKYRLEHTEVYLKSDRSRWFPICYVCNKEGKHLDDVEKWQVKRPDGWIYRYFDDVFISPTGVEVSRPMFPYLARIAKDKQTP